MNAGRSPEANLDQELVGADAAGGGGTGGAATPTGDGSDGLVAAPSSEPLGAGVTDGSLSQDLIVDGTVTSMSSLNPPMNQPPTAMNDSYTVRHDTTLNAPAPGVLFNDSDPNGDPLTAVLVSSPSHASSFTLNSDGSFSYTPTPLWAGLDSFTYKAFDGQLYSTVATAQIDVWNSAPGAQNDLFDARTNVALVIPAPGVLVNDGDPDGDAITAVLDTNPLNGALALNADGSFTYTANPGFAGTDTFKYKSSDGIAQSPAATVTIDVRDVNLEIGDGQSGAFLPEEPAAKNETSRGAYTVANYNDTDGDGLIDLIDDEVRKYTTHFDGPILGGTTDTLTVASTNGFLPYQTVVVADAGQTQFEEMTIRSINGNQIQFGTTLWNSYPVGYYPIGGGTVSHPGRDEVDLMPLRINQVNPVINNDQTVTLTVTGSIRLWYNSWKGTAVPMTGNATAFHRSLLPITIYVEAIDSSAAVRDMSVVLNYQTVADEVKATGIWATVTAVAHETQDATSLLTPPSTFSDMDESPRKTLTNLGGVGLRPIQPAEVRNAIVIQFTIAPHRNVAVEGKWEDDEVFFDAARVREGQLWEQQYTGGWLPYDAEVFPMLVELPNDDADIVGETGFGFSTDHFYSIDGPKVGANPDNPNVVQYAYRMNFQEWLRLGFGFRPDGNAVSGSRASAYYDWHNAHSIDKYLDSNGVWRLRRTTGEAAEVRGENSIGPDFIDLNHP